jgi:hypothetical protein
MPRRVGDTGSGCHFGAANTATPALVLFGKPSPWANTFPIIKPGGDVMTSRLALSAAVAATVLFGAAGSASAQGYEVTQLVPGSAKK